MTTVNNTFIGGQQELADYLGVPLTTVYNWRVKGSGPKGYRVGKHVRFRLEDVTRWLEEHSDAPLVVSRG